MANRRTFIIALAIGLPLLAILASVWVFGSAWIVWSMLPENDSMRLLMNRSLPNRSAALSLISQDELPDAVHSVVLASSKAAISRTPSGLFVAFTPRLQDQFSNYGAITSAGWNVQRRGLVVLAWPNTASPGLPTSSANMAFSLIKNIWRTKTLEPFALFYARGHLAVMVVRHSTAYRAYISDVPDTLRDEHISLGKPAQSADLYVAIPGHVLSVLPKEIASKWNASLVEALGLTRHNLDLVSYLSQYEAVAILQQGENISVNVTGATDSFTAAAAVWLESEDAYSRPQKKAFRLPDGSLGYEWVAGEREEAFQAWQDGCRAPIEGKSSLWLCSKPGQAVLSTSESLARSAPDLNDVWRVEVSPELLSHSLPPETCNEGSSALEGLLCIVSRVQLAGRGHGAVMEVSVK